MQESFLHRRAGTLWRRGIVLRVLGLPWGGGGRVEDRGPSSGVLSTGRRLDFVLSTAGAAGG